MKIRTRVNREIWNVLLALMDPTPIRQVHQILPIACALLDDSDKKCTTESHQQTFRAPYVHLVVTVMVIGMKLSHDLGIGWISYPLEQMAPGLKFWIALGIRDALEQQIMHVKRDGVGIYAHCVLMMMKKRTLEGIFRFLVHANLVTQLW